MELDLQAIVEAVKGVCLNPQVEIEKKVIAITTDSRNILLYSLFIPLRGERFDGHEFIYAVYDQGAIAVLTME